MKTIKIKDKLIGVGKPCFIIAEAGVNHNGDFKIAKKLVDAAKEAGADAVKFQTFTTENIVTKSAEMAQYQKKNTGKTESQFDALKRLELSKKQFQDLKKYCGRKSIIFLSTAHTEDVIDFLNPLVPAFKIASGDITNFPYLSKITGKNKPIILSTGLSNLKEIKEALKIIYKNGNKNVILLHCTSNYPCEIENVNLKAMLTMAKTFKCNFGYSDHTLGIIVPIMAVSLGAQVLEKHITLDNNLPGLDHKASLNPSDFKEMVKAIREAEKAMGSPIKRSVNAEEEIKKLGRKSIAAKVNIQKGKIITEKMLTIKRPGTGISPKFLYKIIGNTAKRDLKADQLLTFKDIK